MNVAFHEFNRRGSHTITKLTVHIVWGTKYRYPVLKWEVQLRCRELLMQICDSEDVQILSWVVSKDHVHMHVEYPPSLSVSDLVQKLKWPTSRKLQDEFLDLSKRYWWKHFWAIGYGAWSTWNITDEMIQKYLEHHRAPSNSDTNTIILEG